MGLLSKLGTIAGTAIGGMFGMPQVGGMVGGGLGKAVEGSGKKKVAGTTQPQYIAPPKTDMADLRSHGTSSAMGIMSRGQDVKVAKSADIPSFGPKDGPMADPWLPMGEWWADLGGEPGRLKKIDDTRLP